MTVGTKRKLLLQSRTFVGITKNPSLSHQHYLIFISARLAIHLRVTTDSVLACLRLSEHLVPGHRPHSGLTDA